MAIAREAEEQCCAQLRVVAPAALPSSLPHREAVSAKRKPNIDAENCQSHEIRRATNGSQNHWIVTAVTDRYVFRTVCTSASGWRWTADSSTCSLSASRALFSTFEWGSDAKAPSGHTGIVHLRHARHHLVCCRKACASARCRALAFGCALVRVCSRPWPLEVRAPSSALR